MKTLSVSNAKPVACQEEAAGRIRFGVGHLLAVLLLAGLLLWGALFFLLELASAAWRSMT